MKKRILFVEDDPLLLQMYSTMLDDDREHWEVAAAAGARQALELINQAPFDVVVSDLIMPGLDGAQLMSEIRALSPRTSRIILSVLSDQERVADCLGTTHQFVAKPFDVKVLKATLARITGLDAYLNDVKLQQLIGQLGTLPSFPSLYVEVMKELRSPNPFIENVSVIVSKDPAMTAKMLQIVNSAAFALARKVGSPFEAVEFLGLGTVQSLVLSAHIFSRFERTNLPGFSVSRLWGHSVACGLLSRLILQIEQPGTMDADDAYTAGMLHDVGQLMLADNLPEQFQQALGLAAQRGISLHEAEQEVFGASHAGAAAYLLGLWGLPAPIVEAVAFHHAPGRSDTREFGLLAAVHAADILEHELHDLSKAESGKTRNQLDADYLASLGVADRVETWRAEAAKLLHSPPGR